MIRYYREIESGDYLSVDHGTRWYYQRIGQPTIREAVATAISQDITSLCTTGVSQSFLREKCRAVAKAHVPAKWRRELEWEDSSCSS